MSLVDAVALFDGSGGTELKAPLRARRHALVVFLYISGLTFLAFRRAVRSRSFMGDPSALVLPLFFFLVAAFAWGVRRGRLRIEPEGVRWGYQLFGFRMKRERIARLQVHDDGVALVPVRGVSPWFLAARDWAHWDEALAAFARLGVPTTRHPGRAPLRIRMQAYGLALDVILVIDSILSTLNLVLG